MVFQFFSVASLFISKAIVPSSDYMIIIFHLPFRSRQKLPYRQRNDLSSTSRSPATLVLFTEPQRASSSSHHLKKKLATCELLMFLFKLDALSCVKSA